MKVIDSFALPILVEASMEVNCDDVQKSFNQIRLIDDLLLILKSKSLINGSRGRKSNKERRFNDIFRGRLLSEVE